ncbi:hypothetical protein PENARI_c003G11877 [Penicillium arizonense]|uniref:Nitrogen regulatory protein areA GATA-like domain-containing protein n=1 Tax=Penicillium arizonense TaxID=1835702 RepID=A0A1F5LSY2_PENAI|nr:hypothetical protein PENARI_c003G11877 [Penicillium arizonense]OGE56140.1 hypothetical protein PENARI_c003G11877 [Penicillium arizonense]
MPSAFDDLSIEDEPTQNADYLSTAWKLEDARATKNYIHKRRATIPNFKRLENALWRAWTQQEQKIPCFSPVLLRWDKESDTTWLFGPHKSFSAELSGASPRLESSAFTLSGSSEKDFTSVETGDQLLSKKSILLSPQRRQIQISLEDKSGVSRKHRSRELSNRVRFNDEVQQVLYIPETVYSYTNFLPIYEAQESITIDAEIYHLRMFLDYQSRDQHHVATATNAFQATEGSYHPPFLSVSDFYIDDDAALQ